MSEWISVKDDLPNPTVDEDGNYEWPVVQVWGSYRAKKRVQLAHYIDSPHLKEWRFEGSNFDATPYITHWRYLNDGPDGL